MMKKLMEVVKKVETDGYVYSYNESHGTHDFSNGDEVIRIADVVDGDHTGYEATAEVIKEKFGYLF